jgi:hypothetical protein
LIKNIQYNEEMLLKYLFMIKNPQNL